MTERQKHLSMVDIYLASLPKSLSSSTVHSKKLEFMADNGIRQLGKPRIGIFADRVKPDPLHCEINAWQHILDLLYSESLLRCCFEKFVETLSAPIGPSGQNSLNQESCEGHATSERVVDVIGEDVHSALASMDNSID